MDEMPDEANRPDGQPAQRLSPEGPTQEEIDASEDEWKTTFEFTMHLLQTTGVIEVVRKSYGGGEKVYLRRDTPDEADVNLELLAAKAGLSGRYAEAFEDEGPHRNYTITAIVAAANKIGITIAEEEIDY